MLWVSQEVNWKWSCSLMAYFHYDLFYTDLFLTSTSNSQRTETMSFKHIRIYTYAFYSLIAWDAQHWVLIWVISHYYLFDSAGNTSIRCSLALRNVQSLGRTMRTWAIRETYYDGDQHRVLERNWGEVSNPRLGAGEGQRAAG